MSSYLLFFGAGDFERLHRMVGNVDVGVIVKRGDAERGRSRWIPQPNYCRTTTITSARLIRCPSWI